MIRRCLDGAAETLGARPNTSNATPMVGTTLDLKRDEVLVFMIIGPEKT
jgi:hypothetical protein